MRICMFTNTYFPHVGGVARSVISFSKDLKNMGHRVLIVAPEFAEMDISEENSEETLRVPAIQNFNGSDFSVRIPIPFLIDNKLDQFQPDIIHSHHPYLLGDAALRAAKRRHLPLIFTHHTLYEQYTHYVSQDSDTMKEFAIHLSTEYANLCTRVIAPSQSIARLIRERGVQKPVVELPTGINAKAFADGNAAAFRKKHDIPDKAFVIGHLGRLAPEKNLVYLATAVSKSMMKLKNAYFLTVGEGPSESDISEILRDQGVEERLIMPGKQTGSDLRDAYHAMDLFAFSSKSETQGLVLVEAMACGLPVIALDAPGAREVLINGENGYLLEDQASDKQFSEAIENIATHPETTKKMKAEALKTAEKFDRSVCAEKLIELYESVIAETDIQNNESTPLELWEKLLISIQTEWELLSQKTSAALKTFNEESDKIELKA